jgi:hypothetical protein
MAPTDIELIVSGKRAKENTGKSNTAMYKKGTSQPNQ